jgi:hypothetical protein
MHVVLTSGAKSMIPNEDLTSVSLALCGAGMPKITGLQSHLEYGIISSSKQVWCSYCNTSNPTTRVVDR